ncbi:MAG: ABC transporter substrate-binding protein [Actinomycetota bacterium]
MRIRSLAVACAVTLIAAACSGQSGDDPSSPPPTAEPTRGGTLNVAMLSDFQAALDPAKQYESASSELYRCCLLRTLLSFEGVPGAEGGSELQPDLASELPTVSDDGLTWTFTLKDGVAYAPPFEDEAVTSEDFVRALEREADPKASVGGYPFYYSVIEGFDRYSQGKAGKISGLSTPDDRTLEVTLTEPTGDLPQRFTLPASAPIPPLGNARMGAAEGHTADYGRYLIATGPYMIEGSDQLDPSVPPDDQEPLSGYVPGRSLIMVRNPSWSADLDPLRPAYVDRIEIVFGGDSNDLHTKIERGDLDVVLDSGPPADVIKRYSTDPALKEHLHVFEADNVSYIEMNVLEPPFDDVHVRRAVNLAIDKQGLRTLLGGEIKGALTGHIMPNSLEDQLLVDYDPYATPDFAGDPEAARAEMAQSAYGDDGGRCTDESCEGVLTFTINQDVFQSQASLIAQNLEEIGITLDLKALNTSTMYSKCAGPAEHMGLCVALGWSKDYPDAVTFATPLFSSESIFPSCCNDPLVGAPDSLLRKYDYDVATVPNVDADINACTAESGQARVECWTALDRRLMEEVVPWVPWLITNSVYITSADVVAYSFDQSSSSPALERLALAPEG